ncbi:MAG: type II toxin-antitoxin system RelE/ParE family toxin [Thomasclavelia ramosa]|nr:type II toxin-antitoxin system RelE/ParE family toxin [Thomasclavelia ramosa]
MRYKVVFSKTVLKQLKKMDKYTKLLLINWIENNLDGCDDPRVHGKALSANRSGQWRYRIGDYRLICKIEDNKLVIFALSVGHRKDVYKR